MFVSGVGPELFPVAPLLPLLARAHAQVEERNWRTAKGTREIRGGWNELCRQYADRYGCSLSAADALFRRIRQGQVSVSLDTADKLSLFLGSGMELWS